MTTTLKFCRGDWYIYDFAPCSYGNGWAQLDMTQEVSHFRTLVNPAQLMIFNYREGDMTLNEAASPAEFAEEPSEFEGWKRAHGYDPARFDRGFDPAMHGRPSRCGWLIFCVDCAARPLFSAGAATVNRRHPLAGRTVYA